MIRQDLPNCDPAKDEDLAALRQSSEADINAVFDKATAIVDGIPSATKPDVAQEMRRKQFTELKSTFKALANATRDGKKKVAALPTKFDPSQEPALPPIMHFSVLSKCTYQLPTKEQVSLMCLDRTPFPTTPVLETFKTLLADHDPLRNDQKTTELRICITGGDRLLHSFLCAVSHIKLMEEDLLRNINLKFYLLPAASRNHVAAFLARHDSWYNRHVYLPFRSGAFILPWLNCDEETSVIEPESVDLPPPGVFYRKLTEDYLRESETSFPFNVYKIEGWLGSKDASGSGAGGDGGGSGAGGRGAGGGGAGAGGGAGGGSGGALRGDAKMMAAIAAQQKQEEEEERQQKLERDQKAAAKAAAAAAKAAAAGGAGGAGGATPAAGDVKSKPASNGAGGGGGAGSGDGDDKDSKSGGGSAVLGGASGGGAGTAPLSDEEKFGHDQMIPFIQRVEIGIIAHAERCRESSKGKIPEYQKVDDILKDKSMCHLFPSLLLCLVDD